MQQERVEAEAVLLSLIRKTLVALGVPGSVEPLEDGK
jgi:hypothetical protein